jgi:hypothetical protein
MNFFLPNSSFLEPLNFWPKCVPLSLSLSLAFSLSLFLSLAHFLSSSFHFPSHSLVIIHILKLRAVLCLLFVVIQNFDLNTSIFPCYFTYTAYGNISPFEQFLKLNIKLWCSKLRTFILNLDSILLLYLPIQDNKWCVKCLILTCTMKFCQYQLYAWKGH